MAGTFAVPIYRIVRNFHGTKFSQNASKIGFSCFIFHEYRQSYVVAIFANCYYIQLPSQTRTKGNHCKDARICDVAVSGANGYPESNMLSNVLSNVPWQVTPAGASPSWISHLSRYLECRYGGNIRLRQGEGKLASRGQTSIFTGRYRLQYNALLNTYFIRGVSK